MDEAGETGTEPSDIIRAIAGMMASLAVWEESQVPATFQPKLRRQLGDGGAARVYLRRYSGPREGDRCGADGYPMVPMLHWDLLSAKGRSIQSLDRGWRHQRAKRVADLRGAMAFPRRRRPSRTPESGQPDDGALGGLIATERKDQQDKVWIDGEGRPLPAEMEIVATFSAWEWNADGAQNIALEFETDDGGMIVAALLLRASEAPPGGNPLIAEVKRDGAQIARTAVRQYWTAWDGHWSRKVQDAITKEAPAVSVAEPRDHVELFRVVSGQLNAVVSSIADALSAPAAALFVPVGSDALGLMSAQGYEAPLPRRLPEYTRGLTGFLCTALVPERRDHRGRPMAYTCVTGDEVRDAYAQLDLYHGPLTPHEVNEQGGAGVYLSDRNIERRLRARVLRGPWVWAPLPLKGWGDPRPVRLPPTLNLGLAVEFTLRGVLKLVGRSACKLDRPNLPEPGEPLSDDRIPPPFSRRELRRIHSYSELLSAVVRRLIDVGAAGLRERLLRTVAVDLALDDPGNAAEAIRQAMAAQACFVLASPRHESTPVRQIVAEAYEDGFDLERIDEHRNPRSRAPGSESAEQRRPVVWSGHGVDLVIFDPAEEIPVKASEDAKAVDGGRPSLVQIWRPAKDTLLAMLASMRGRSRQTAHAGSPMRSDRRRRSQRTQWGDALAKLREVADLVDEQSGVVSKATARALIDAVLRLHVTFASTAAFAEAAVLSQQYSRKQLSLVYGRLQREDRERFGDAADVSWNSLRELALAEGYGRFKDADELTELLDKYCHVDASS